MPTSTDEEDRLLTKRRIERQWKNTCLRVTRLPRYHESDGQLSIRREIKLGSISQVSTHCEGDVHTGRGQRPGRVSDSDVVFFRENKPVSRRSTLTFHRDSCVSTTGRGVGAVNTSTRAVAGTFASKAQPSSCQKSTIRPSSHSDDASLPSVSVATSSFSSTSPCGRLVSMVAVSVTTSSFSSASPCRKFVWIVSQ